MGSGEVGGGGSVHWHVSAWKKKPVYKAFKNDGMFHDYGADGDGKAPQKFTIRIKLPMSLGDFKKGLPDAGKTLEFTLPIAEDDEKQIQISWGIQQGMLKQAGKRKKKRGKRR